MRIAKTTVVLVLALSSAACLNWSTDLTVRPDGSGTIQQTTTMTAEAMAQMSQLASTFGALGGGNKSTKPPELFTEADARAAATKLGDGVTYVSSERIKTKDAEGIRAIYGFTDITKVRLNEKPSAPVAAQGAMAVGGSAPEDIHFRFARQPGGTSVVTLVFPELTADQVKKVQAAEAKQTIDPQAMSMVRMALKGLRISIVLQVAGRIVKTNSPYVQGSKVTLLEMNFDDLLADETLLAKLQGIDSLEQAKAILKGVKGFKFNFDREVAVEFASR